MRPFSRTAVAGILTAMVSFQLPALDYELELGAEGTLAFRDDYTFSYAGFLLLESENDFAVGDGQLLAGDLTEFALRRQFPAARRGFYSISVGRQEMRDLSGLILSAPTDGIGLLFDREPLQLAAQIGLTGLLLDPTSSYIETPGEVRRVDPLLGPSRFLNRYSLVRSDLTGSHELEAELLINLDLPEEDEPLLEDAYDSFTLGVGLNGPVVRKIDYSLFLFGQQSSYYGEQGRDRILTRALSAAAGGELGFDMNHRMNPRVEVGILWASGDRDHPLFSDSGGGMSTQFNAISDTELSLVLPLSLSNLLRASCAASLTDLSDDGEAAGPGSQLAFESGIAVFFRPEAAPGMLIGAPTRESPAGYMGSELSISVAWSPVAELELRLVGGVFVPGEGFLDEEFPDNELGSRIALRGHYRMDSK